jgi:Flp pilus assembly protein TadG
MVCHLASLGRRLRAASRSDRGSSVIELAVLAPAFLGVVMLIIQFGLWFNARQVALASAQAGARVARIEYANTAVNWQADATGAARNYFRALDTRLLGQLDARPATGTDAGALKVGVTVSGQLGYSVFSWFGMNWNVSATVTGPVECFRPANDGGACG